MNQEQISSTIELLSSVIETLGGRPLNERTQQIWEQVFSPLEFEPAIKAIKEWSFTETVPPKPADIVRQLSPSIQSTDGRKSFPQGNSNGQPQQPLLKEKRNFVPNELDDEFVRRIFILFDYSDLHPCPDNYNLRTLLGRFVREPATLKKAHLEYLFANKAITLNGELTGLIEPAYCDWEKACGSIELEKALGMHEHLSNVKKEAIYHNYYWDPDGHVFHFFPDDFPLNNIKYQFGGFDPLADRQQRTIFGGFARRSKNKGQSDETDKNFGHWQSAF